MYEIYKYTIYILVSADYRYMMDDFDNLRTIKNTDKGFTTDVIVDITIILLLIFLFISQTDPVCNGLVIIILNPFSCLRFIF